MNCREQRSNLIELSRGGPLRGSGERELRDHLNRCPECARLLEGQQKLNGAMHNLAAQAAAILLPEDVEKRVRAELDTFDHSRKARERDSPTGIGSSHGRSSRRWIPVIGSAVAASVLAAWFLIGRRAVEPDSNHDRPSAVAAPGNTQRGAAAVQPLAATTPSGTPGPAVARVTKSGAARPAGRSAITSETPSAALAAAPVTEHADEPVAAAAAGTTPNETTQPFIAIPYTEPIAPYERASVMRMDLPAAAVMAAGLPLETRDAGERVRADVLVGEDGRARAIRLLYVSNAGIE